MLQPHLRRRGVNHARCDSPTRYQWATSPLLSCHAKTPSRCRLGKHNSAGAPCVAGGQVVAIVIYEIGHTKGVERGDNRVGPR